MTLSDVHIFVYQSGAEFPYLEWQTDVGDDLDDNGSFRGTLPEGDWELEVYAKGRPTSERIPVTIQSGDTMDVVLGSPQPGAIHFNVRDEVNRHVPAKVSFFSVNNVNTLNPDRRLHGKSTSAVFSPRRRPSGSTTWQYYAVASRASNTN